MTKLSAEEEARRKQAIFESMSPRRQQHILKKGYEKWDPFLEPKDPIDIRRDRSQRTTQQLVREFLQTRPPDQPYSNTYGQGVLDLCLGIINQDDRYLAMYDFCVWYQQLLIREGHSG